MKTLWQHCHVATMAQGKYSIIEDAAMVTAGSLIEWIGPRSEVPTADYAQVHDLQGAWVTPGLIDCHTHTVFGGNRSGEFEKRLQGVSYAEIAAQGGGIASTVRATREATEDELFASAAKRLKSLMRDGVTTVEMKSGYGLDLATEQKILEVAAELDKHHPASVQKTFLGAHALPGEFSNDADGYIEAVCQMLPQLHALGLVDAVDVFCEGIGFNLEQTRKVFTAATALGLLVKAHAEQLSNLGGSALVAEFEKAEQQLKGRGRLLIRKSGTEPVIRVMVEGDQQQEVETLAHQLADAVRAQAQVA